MDQFAFVNQASTKLQVSVSTGKPESIRVDAQNLIAALVKLGNMVPATGEPSDIGREQAMNGLQTLSALASNGMTSLLLDGPQLFPMLGTYMKSPWVTTGVAPIAFAVVYNLCQLNGARLDSFVDSGGLSALDSYLRLSIDTNISKESKEAQTQKLNLALALLYQIGSPKNYLQAKFLEQGGLTLVLDHFNSAKSVLVFLSSFIALETPTEVIDIILSHPEFAGVIDSMYADEPSDDEEEDSDGDEIDSEKNDTEAENAKKEQNAKVLMIAQVLRNLCLLQGSADVVLPLLARFLGHNLAIADEAISALSNLAATQQDRLDFRYAWDSSLIGMVISSAVRICRKLVQVAQADVAAATSNRNAAGRKHVLARVLQILRTESCLKIAGESSAAGRPGYLAQSDAEESENDEDEKGSGSEGPGSDDECHSHDEDEDIPFLRDDAHALVDLCALNKDLLETNRSWARTISRYLSLLPCSVAWNSAKQIVEIHRTCVIEKDEVEQAKEMANKAAQPSSATQETVHFKDSEFDVDKALEGLRLSVPLCVMWRRMSRVRLEAATVQLPKAGFDTVIQGEVNCNAFSAVLSGLAKHPIKLATMFKLPSIDQQKWHSGPITVNLFDFRTSERKSVVIDDRVPCYIYSKPISIWTGSSQAWLPLIEKACVKLLGSYESLAKLSLEHASELLTGVKAVKCKLPPAEQFKHVIDSELSEQSIMLYTIKHEETPTDKAESSAGIDDSKFAPAHRDDSHDVFVIDTIETTSEGPTVASYNPASFDLRRGWDASSGNFQTSIPSLHSKIASLYKLKLN